MKDEIKEILDELNKNKEEIRHYEYYPDDVLNCEDLIKLLDYITNLQEENEKLNNIINGKFTDICKKEMIGKLSAVDMIVLQQERIDKAIEYIYHWSTQRKKFFDKIDRQLNGKPQFYGDIADLLNILQGEDNEKQN